MNNGALAFLVPGLVIGLVSGFVMGKASDFSMPKKAHFVRAEGRIERAEFRAAYLELRNTLDRAVTCRQAAPELDVGYWQGKLQELRKSTNHGLFADDVKIVDADIQIKRGAAQFQCEIGGTPAIITTSDMISKIKLLDKIVS